MQPNQQQNLQVIYPQIELTEENHEQDKIALPSISYKYTAARTFIKNPELMAAAVHIGEKVYKTPYTEHYRLISSNFTYTCSDGTVINRPNHNMANIMRTLYYLQPVLEYLSRNGNSETQNLLGMLEENEIQKILFLQLFYCSGRTNEVGFAQSPEISMQHRAAAEFYFKEYFAAKPDKTPFRDMQEIEHYAEILRDCYYIFDGKIKAKEPKDKAISMILVFCHSLDLPRCYSGYNWQRQIDKFNKYSRIPNNRDLQKLLLYAQRCIVATGDMLCTQYQTQEIHGVHEPTSFNFRLKETRRRLMHAGSNWFVSVAKQRNDELYKEATRVDADGVEKTAESLSRVVDPVFFGGNPVNTSYKEAEILECIETGNAASRGFNGLFSNVSLRFEVEQLINPEYVRPLKEGKLARRHDLRVDLISGDITQFPERDYLPIQDQKRVASPQDYALVTSVSRQEDRGKPKNTAYQKKCSYSLVPKSGIFSTFMGRRQDRIFNKYIGVGFLHDTSKMNLHGEKYVWFADVSSSGIGGYFWLAKDAGVRPANVLTALQTIRDESICCNLEELKSKINDPAENIDFNEFLGSGSIDSLMAIYTVSNDPEHILAALYAQCVLLRDYGIERNIVILDGKNKPRVVKEDELKQVWIQINQQLQNSWSYWFKSIFYQPIVQQLVIAINSVSNHNPFDLKVSVSVKNQEEIAIFLQEHGLEGIEMFKEEFLQHNYDVERNIVQILQAIKTYEGGKYLQEFRSILYVRFHEIIEEPLIHQELIQNLSKAFQIFFPNPNFEAIDSETWLRNLCNFNNKGFSVIQSLSQGKKILFLGFRPLIEEISIEKEQKIEQIIGNVQDRMIALEEMRKIFKRTGLANNSSFVTIMDIICQSVEEARQTDRTLPLEGLKITIFSMQALSELFTRQGLPCEVATGLHFITNQEEIDRFVEKIQPYLVQLGILRENTKLSIKIQRFPFYDHDLIDPGTGKLMEFKKFSAGIEKAWHAYHDSDYFYGHCWAGKERSANVVMCVLIRDMLDHLTHFNKVEESLKTPVGIFHSLKKQRKEITAIEAKTPGQIFLLYSYYFERIDKYCTENIDGQDGINQDKKSRLLNKIAHSSDIKQDLILGLQGLGAMHEIYKKEGREQEFQELSVQYTSFICEILRKMDQKDVKNLIDILALKTSTGSIVKRFFKLVLLTLDMVIEWPILGCLSIFPGKIGVLAAIRIDSLKAQKKRELISESAVKAASQELNNLILVLFSPVPVSSTLTTELSTFSVGSPLVDAVDPAYTLPVGPGTGAPTFMSGENE